MRTTTVGGWSFDNSYTTLPQRLFVRHNPRAVARPRLVMLNEPLARQLGLDVAWLRSDEGINMLAGCTVVPGSVPIAQAYAGQQFGHFTMLGDGRAILLGEHIAPDGQRFDIQLKGSGRTPFSRGGDGLAAVGPMVREYLISEALFALGIPTTRSLAVVDTGEKVVRDQLLDGAVLTRVAASHIRIGTFEYAAACNDRTTLAELLKYTLRRHYPDVHESVTAACALLERVVERQATLIAQWMLVGFVHGVMNTDNMTLSGETIDYGPCAFIDAFDPNAVFSSIDVGGRYTYGNQPAIAQWNLARLAEALLPLIAPNQDEAVAVAEQLINRFSPIFRQVWLKGAVSKIGLMEERAGDENLIESLLGLMHKHALDYTATFRGLATAMGDDSPGWPAPLESWRSRWLARVDSQPLSRHEAARLCAASNPAVIPRNHLVEEALSAIISHGDYSPVQSLLGALGHPYESRVSTQYYERTAEHPNPHYRTFCGT